MGGPIDSGSRASYILCNYVDGVEAVKIDIIKIGNSRGVRLPKAILEQCGIGDEAVLEVRDGEVVLRSLRRRPREGWRKAFAGANATQVEGEPLIGDLASEFDSEDWTWPDIPPAGIATKATGRK